MGVLDEVRDVHGHLLDLGVVELLDVAQVADVAGGEEVDLIYVKQGDI